MRSIVSAMGGDPVEVAQLVLREGGGSVVAEAAMLVDVVESASFRGPFAAAFSPRAVELARRAVRAARVQWHAWSRTSLVTTRSAFVAIAGDPEAVLVALAERLSSAHRLRARRPFEFAELSRQMREVHAPIAAQFGYLRLARGFGAPSAKAAVDPPSESCVYALTPAFEVKRLLAGATAIDFAYAVHSELGLRCARVRINGSELPLDTVLASGDLVEILRAERAGVQRLDLARTAHARNRIRHSIVPAVASR